MIEREVVFFSAVVQARSPVGSQAHTFLKSARKWSQYQRYLNTHSEGPEGFSWFWSLFSSPADTFGSILQEWQNTFWCCNSRLLNKTSFFSPHLKTLDYQGRRHKNTNHFCLWPNTQADKTRASYIYRCSDLPRQSEAIFALAPCFDHHVYDAHKGTWMWWMGRNRPTAAGPVGSGRAQGVKMKMSMFILHAPLNSDGRTISPQLTQHPPPPRLHRLRHSWQFPVTLMYADRQRGILGT